MSEEQIVAALAVLDKAFPNLSPEKRAQVEAQLRAVAG